MSKINSNAWLRRWAGGLLLTGSLFGIGANAQPSDSFHYSVETRQAQAVAMAREAARSEQWHRLPALASQAQGDPLAIYADYWNALGALKQASAVNSVPLAQAFLERYPDTYMADTLRAQWVLRAVELGEFAKVEQLGEFPWMNSQVRCSKLLAQHMTGTRVNPLVAQETFSAGQACWSMIERLARDGVMPRDVVVTMVLDAFEVNHVRTAGRLAPLVFKGGAMQDYRQMMRSPVGWLDSNQATKLDVDQALIAAIALSRLARDQQSKALADIRTTWSKRLPPAMLSWVQTQIALRSALNLDMTLANHLYQQAGNIPLTTTGYEWRTRAALRQPKIDWKWVETTIDWMPKDLQQDSAWLYWKARAQLALGQPDAAQAIYTKLAPRFDFYGQLASEELGMLIKVPKAPSPVTDRELQQARDNPHLQQAVALFRQGWRPEAVPQWNYSLRNMNDRELLAAAEFAREQHIYDRVVNTSERTRDSVDFSQRYIAPFEGKVSARASAINLDPAWVYGLIRQESRFIMDARSVAGATGLMQLMPATARYVAKRIGMADFHPSRVNEFDVNTELGTQYLRMVLEDLDGSQVLASAGYNAGPGRSVRWRAALTHPVEGAIFAETIPFSETRDYVKQVLSNATYYAALFTGQPQSLKQRLGQIAPKVR